MSGEIWVHELEELKDVPVLEGELEWVITVTDEAVKTEDVSIRSDGGQERNGKTLKS